MDVNNTYIESSVAVFDCVYNILYFFQYKNENDQNGTFENFIYMENYINLPCLLRSRQAPTPGRFGPDRPEGEICCLKGGIGWGVPLGNEGSGEFKYLCYMLYTLFELTYAKDKL